MEEGYWIKYGYKEDGNLVCVRSISNTKPDENFFIQKMGNIKKLKTLIH